MSSYDQGTCTSGSRVRVRSPEGMKGTDMVMRSWVYFVLLIVVGCTSQQMEQGLGVINEAMQTSGGSGAPMGSSQVAQGLKAALEKGAEFSGKELSRTDGFLKNQAIKILFPQEFRKTEETLRTLGLGSLADQAVMSFNRAAEKASAEAFPILVNAIRQMTIQDAMKILLGPNDSATEYLQKATTAQLRARFLPVVKKSADAVSATKYWNDVASKYNQIPLVKKVPADISGYITDKTLTGLFHRIRLEEADIRANPAARTTSILRSVFGYADTKKGR